MNVAPACAKVAKYIRARHRNCVACRLKDITTEDVIEVTYAVRTLFWDAK